MASWATPYQVQTELSVVFTKVGQTVTIDLNKRLPFVSAEGHPQTEPGAWCPDCHQWNHRCPPRPVRSA